MAGAHTFIGGNRYSLIPVLSATLYHMTYVYLSLGYNLKSWLSWQQDDEMVKIQIASVHFQHPADFLHHDFDDRLLLRGLPFSLLFQPGSHRDFSDLHYSLPVTPLLILAELFCCLHPRFPPDYELHLSTYVSQPSYQI